MPHWYFGTGVFTLCVSTNVPNLVLGHSDCGSGSRVGSPKDRHKSLQASHEWGVAAWAFIIVRWQTIHPSVMKAEQRYLRAQPDVALPWVPSVQVYPEGERRDSWWLLSGSYIECDSKQMELAASWTQYLLQETGLESAKSFLESGMAEFALISENGDFRDKMNSLIEKSTISTWAVDCEF